MENSLGRGMEEVEEGDQLGGYYITQAKMMVVAWFGMVKIELAHDKVL